MSANTKLKKEACTIPGTSVQRADVQVHLEMSGEGKDRTRRGKCLGLKLTVTFFIDSSADCFREHVLKSGWTAWGGEKKRSKGDWKTTGKMLLAPVQDSVGQGFNLANQDTSVAVHGW